MKDSKRRLIERLKITRKELQTIEKIGYSVEMTVLKNQVAIMNALADLLVDPPNKD